MSKMLMAVFASTLTVVSGLAAQQAPPATPSQLSAPTMTGCVSPKPDQAGQYTLTDADSPLRYRLTGKQMRKYAGKRVEIVGPPSGSGLTIKGGLWPAPAGGARGVAQDPAAQAVAIQQAQTGTATPGEFPELKVSKVRLVRGVCE